VRKQYAKKFGRFGDAVVKSNMEVMEQGFSRVVEIKLGRHDEPDRSSMRNPLLKPFGEHHIIPTAGCADAGCGTIPPPPPSPCAPRAEPRQV
jgi:pyruvate-ferredoxin/flavodoxin oxidoreductase